MMSLLVEAAPILFGYIAKLIAIKSKASSDMQKLQIQALNANAAQINAARDQSNKESPMAALTRRIVVFCLLGFVGFYLIAGAFLDVPTIVPIIHKATTFLGIFEITPERIEYLSVNGLLKHVEIFEAFMLMIKFWFGGQLGKA